MKTVRFLGGCKRCVEDCRPFPPSLGEDQAQNVAAAVLLVADFVEVEVIYS